MEETDVSSTAHCSFSSSPMELQSPPPQPPPPPPPPPPSNSPQTYKLTYKLTANSITYLKSTNYYTLLTPSFPPLSSLLFKPCTSPTPPTNNYILRQVSLTAHPSQILAIVGPSGAGKSTLLDILAARTSPTTGILLLNSSPVNPSAFRKLSAYVPQHDYYLPLLTVYETFIFTARLLDPTSSQTHTTVLSLLKELSLSHVAHARLGAGGLSGGERRRVSIGLSLLHDPAVLLLDEPTSGLDSKSAMNVIETLRSIATSRHRTVILSIHQPSFNILSIIDAILLLWKGQVVHHGTMTSLEQLLLSNGFSVPPQLNPLEYAMEILNQLLIRAPQSAEQTTLQNNMSNVTNISVTCKSSRIQQVRILCSRFWKIIYRTRQLLLTNSMEALIVGLVLGTIYINIGNDKQGIEKRFGFFAFSLTFLLSSTTQILPIFITERPILIRETSSGVYRLSSYLVANTLIFFPYLLALALIYSSVYFLVGLCASWTAFAYFILLIWLILLMGNSFVLFLSSFAPNYITGTSLVSILLGAFFLFSGYFIPQQSMPKYWLFMHFFSMYKYPLDAFLINEYSCHSKTCFVAGYGDDQGGSTDYNCMLTGRDVLQKRGLHERQRWTNIYALIGFFLFYRVLCLLVLIRRVSKSKI